MDPQLRKALSNDSVFKAINKKFIKLQEDAVKANNVRLDRIMKSLIELMQTVDQNFKNAYQEIVYTGSFYKGTKICEPMEFDLNMVIRLPFDYNVIKVEPSFPGYVRLFVGPLPKNVIGTEAEKKRKWTCAALKNKAIEFARWIRQLLVDGYIHMERFRQWIEGIVHRALSKLPYNEGYYALSVPETMETYQLKTKKSGPAFTIVVKIPRQGCMCIDLVPALQFRIPVHVGGVHQTFSQFVAKTWNAVPKPFYEDVTFKGRTSWRLSFYQQEREILRKYGRIKPVMKQMKKLRDRQNWKNMVSYYIETLFLNKLSHLGNVDNTPFTLLFFTMLEEFRNACKTRYINYYWDKNCNLLKKIGKDEIANIASRLDNIIESIKKKIYTDPLIIARYMLNEEELKILTEYMAQTESKLEPESLKPDQSYPCILL